MAAVQGKIAVDRKEKFNEESATVFLTLSPFCQVYRREADGVMRKAGDITRRYILSEILREKTRNPRTEGLGICCWKIGVE